MVLFRSCYQTKSRRFGGEMDLDQFLFMSLLGTILSYTKELAPFFALQGLWISLLFAKVNQSNHESLFHIVSELC